MTPKVIKVSSITVGDFYERHREILDLELVGPEVGFDKNIREPALNRPGLALADFFTYFAKKRVQVLGNSELSYLKKLGSPIDLNRFGKLCKQGIPCLVIARGQQLTPELAAVAQEEGIAVFSSPMVTMKFLNLATIRLETEFAESTSLHGCMVDYRGVGVLIMGKSGSGKSETAIGLLERGAALVADDLVRIRNVGGELNTAAPDLSRGYIEMRGIGIINAANLFGLSAIRPEKRLDLVVTLKGETDLNNVDRLGIRRKAYQILGVGIPHVEIPVAAGRDTARLVAVAALDLQLRRLGYDMADEFNQKLLARMSASKPAI
jgi:HPr kinase/phosphorylase